MTAARGKKRTPAGRAPERDVYSADAAPAPAIADADVAAASAAAAELADARRARAERCDAREERRAEAEVEMLYARISGQQAYEDVQSAEERKLGTERVSIRAQAFMRAAFGVAALLIAGAVVFGGAT